MSEFGQVQIINVLKEILQTLKEIQSRQDWFVNQINDNYDEGNKNV